MLSIVPISRALVLACVFLASLCGAAPAAHAAHKLSCQSGGEHTALKQAPSGARRVQEHVLEVAFKGGSKRFEDMPPHEEMGGAHWRYCGFDANAKAHLIEMSEAGLFSGELLFEETGKTMRAGHTVLFSPGGQEFVAIEQEDGIDGESWSVHDIGGTVKWKGYAGTTQKVDGIEMVISTFEHPQWKPSGELTARFSCAATKVSGLVTLVRSSGNWSWRGHAKC